MCDGIPRRHDAWSHRYLLCFVVLGFEVDPNRGGFAVFDGPMFGDLDHGVGTGDAEIYQRHDLVAIGEEDVIG